MYLLATPQTTCYRQKTPDSLREIQGFCQVFARLDQARGRNRSAPTQFLTSR